MSTQVTLSIVFLNFNRLKETQFTIQQLDKLCANRNDIEIIAVDNGSTDGTAEYLQRQSTAKALLLKDNTGIAGYNHGFEIATGEYILVLDDDSCPESINTLNHAIQHLQQTPEIGIIACRIKTPDQQDQWSWHLPKQHTYGSSPFFIGCGFFIRRELFKKTGWYPDNFFLYQNEIEVSFQTRLHGYEIYYDPASIVIHRGRPNQRPGWRRVFFPTRNTLWLIRRYYPQPIASYMILSRIIIGLYRAISFRELAQFSKALYAGLNTPIKKDILTPDLRTTFAPFYRQNSILHQLFRRV